MTAFETIDGTGPILLICDHASNRVPPDIDLAIDPALLDQHIAVDIGAAAVTRSLADRLGAPAILGTVSRLVIDLHRQVDHPGLIPVASDGHDIPGNHAADRAALIARFHAPYHRAVAAMIDRHRPRLIVSVHSFTPALATGGPPRPWEVGILSNRDRRAANLAVALFGEAGCVTGDNQPYSGRLLNATLNRHAEGRGIASFAIELRQDLLSDAAGVACWTERVAGVVATIEQRMR